MSKKNNDNILKRVRVLYWVLFTFIIVVVAANAYAFVSGFSHGMAMGVKNMEKGYSAESVLDYDIHNGACYLDFPINIGSTEDSSIVMSARAHSYDIITKGKPGTELYSPGKTASSILTFTWLFCYIAIFILLFNVLGSIKNSLKRNTVFSRRIIGYTRWVGALLITASLLSEAATYLSHIHTADMIDKIGASAALELSYSFSVSSVTEIITGVMVLFLAEVFAIGYDMTEEQKLTI